MDEALALSSQTHGPRITDIQPQARDNVP